MHTSTSSRRARSIASASVWTKPTSTRNEFVCSIENGTPRAFASGSTGASAASSAPAASSHGSGPAGPVVNTRHSALMVAAVSSARDPLSLCVAAGRLGEVEGSETDEIPHPEPGVGDSAGTVLPPEPLELRDRDADVRDAHLLVEPQIGLEVPREGRDGAERHARVHARSAEGEAASGAPAAVEGQVHAGHELRLRAGEVHR